MRKKLVALLLVLLQAVSMAGVCVYAADDVGQTYIDLQFDDGQLAVGNTAWAQNTPEAVNIDGVGAACIKGAEERVAYYQYEMKNLSLKGKLTIETRVKLSTASVFFVKGFMNSGGSLGFSPLMARFTDEKLGAVWLNSDRTSDRLDQFTTDVSVQAPDMQTGWSTIWIDVDTQAGTYTTYMNHRGHSFSGTFVGSADNFLHNLRFGAQCDKKAADPVQYAYVDYIKVYSSDLQDIPESGELDVAISSNFDDLSPGSNLRKGLFNNMSDTAATAMVAADPLNADNQCVRLQSGTVQKGMVSVGASDVSLEFSAYMPTRVGNELISFTTDSAAFSCTTNATDDNIAFGGSGETGAMAAGAWNAFRFEIDLSTNTNNVLCYLNGTLAATKSLAGSKLTSIRFGIPGGVPLYLDDFRLLSDNGTARISASKQNGEMQYGEKVYLTSDIADAEIYYTIDGSRPDETSLRYTDDGIAIETNQMCIRAVAVSGGIPGRVYTFGKYRLHSVDGLIVTGVTFSSNTIAAGGQAGATVGILNTDAPRTAWAAIGVYADGALLAMDGKELILDEGITTEKLSVSAPAGYDYRNADARVFLWSSDSQLQTLAEAYGMHDNGMGSKPAISAKSAAPSLTDVQCSLNSTSGTLHISGSVTDAVAGQDISVLVRKTDTPDGAAALLQSYVADDGGFSVKIPLKSNIAGGYYTVQIGGRAISQPISRSVYYVDSNERAAAVAELNQTKSAAEMLTALMKFQETGILALDFENETYIEQPENVAKWVYQTKEVAAFENIEAVSDKFLAATAIIPVLQADADDLTATLASYNNALPFTKEASYDIAVMQKDKEAAALNRTLAAQFETSPGDVYAFEKKYKTAYAIAQINLAARSEMERTIETYNAILGLDLTGDYQKVSAYEVAKALYDKNYTSETDIRADFNKRIRELLSAGGGSGSSGGSAGGSSGGKRLSSISQTLAVPGISPNIPPAVEPDPSDTETVFPDIGSEHWAYHAIAELKRKNILSGFEDGTFRPNSHITRAELVAMLTAAYALEADVADLPFADVSPDDWYYPAAAAAYHAGIIKGDGQNFRPDAEIRREDMAVMVYRLVAKTSAEGQARLAFADAAEISAYAYDAVAYLTAKGVVNGFADGNFQPGGALTRAEGAKILCGILDMQ